MYNTAAHILELAVYKVAEIAMFDLSTSIKTVWLRQGMYMAHQSHFFPNINFFSASLNFDKLGPKITFFHCWKKNVGSQILQNFYQT